MSCILFNASGSFSPLDYGLSIGDLIQVVAVGGGQGGSMPGINCVYDGEGNLISSTSGGNGGFGGASSFGNLLSALGGGNAYTYTGGYGFGGGAGGWIPGIQDWGGDGEGGSGASLGIVNPIVGTAGYAGKYQGGAPADIKFQYIARGKFNCPTGLVSTYNNGGTYWNYTTRCMTGLYYGGGGGQMCVTPNATPYWPYYCSGSGGSGFGAGGGACGYNGRGGCAGAVAMGSFRIASLDAIAVGVGGGGAGGSWVGSHYYDGGAGSTGSYGTNPANGAIRGGYAGICGGQYRTDTYIADTASCGGGAGGCVAVFF